MSRFCKFSFVLFFISLSCGGCQVWQPPIEAERYHLVKVYHEKPAVPLPPNALPEWAWALRPDEAEWIFQEFNQHQ